VSSSHNVGQAILLPVKMLLALLPVLLSASTVTVNTTVTPTGGLFHYDYAIANGTIDDAFLVDIHVAHNPSYIQNLMAPSGFQTAFDPNLGLVSFLEDTAMFTSTPLGGFSFDSPLAPMSSTFTASLVDSSSNIYTVSGSALAPVPEPGYFAVLAGLGILAIGIRKRSRQ
jgi:hypothetical protein